MPSITRRAVSPRHRVRATIAATLTSASVIAMAEKAASAQVDDPPKALAVESIALTVADLDRSVEWYTRVLDCRLTDERELEGEEAERLLGVFGARVRVATLRLGEERLDLIDFVTPEGRPVPADSRGNDRWFQHVAIIVRDMEAAYARLRAHGVGQASSGPQTLPAWNAAAGGIRAFYFRDPDGHFLEVLDFPQGKGDPRWHAATSDLFLGIDHTAIVVDDTDASLRFYRDGLGMRVAGESENHGPEQERLNAVFGARLRITTLRADRGPAVELLEYLTPRDGRPYPLDSRANDLWHWHVGVRTERPAAWFRRARLFGALPVSPGAIDADLPDRDSGEALLLRDPDGHALLLFTDD